MEQVEAILPETLKKQLLDNKDLVIHLLPMIHKIKSANPDMSRDELLAVDGILEKAIDSLESVPQELKESMKSYPLLSMLVDALNGAFTIDKLMLIVSESHVDELVDAVVPDSIENKIPVEVRKSVIKMIVTALKNILTGCMSKKAVAVSATNDMPPLEKCPDASNEDVKVEA